MDLKYADTCIKKGSMLLKREDFNLAIHEFKKAQPIIEHHQSKTERLTYVYNEIGEANRNIGNHQEAKEYYEKMIEIEENILPNTLSIAITYNNYALCLSSLKKFEESMAFHKKSLAIREAIDPESKNCAIAYNNIGLLMKETDKVDEALQYYRKAEEIKNRLEPNTISLAVTLNNIAALYRDNKNFEESSNYYKKSIEIRKDKAPDVLSSSYPYMGFAKLLVAQDKYEEAKPYAERAFAIREKNLIENHPFLFTDACFLANLYIKLKDFEKCKLYCEYLEKKDKNSKEANYFYSVCCFHKGEFEKSFELLEKVLESNHNYAEANLFLVRFFIKIAEEAKVKNEIEMYLKAVFFMEQYIGKEKTFGEMDDKENKINEVREEIKKVKEEYICSSDEENYILDNDFKKKAFELLRKS